MPKSDTDKSTEEYMTQVGVRILGRFGREDRAIAEQFRLAASCPDPNGGQDLHFTGLTTGIDKNGMGFRAKYQGIDTKPQTKEMFTKMVDSPIVITMDLYGILDLNATVLKCEEAWDDADLYLVVKFDVLPEETVDIIEKVIRSDIQKRLTRKDDEMCKSILTAYGLRGCFTCTLECQVRETNKETFYNMLDRHKMPVPKGELPKDPDGPPPVAPQEY